MYSDYLVLLLLCNVEVDDDVAVLHVVDDVVVLPDVDDVTVLLVVDDVAVLPDVDDVTVMSIVDDVTVLPVVVST